MIPTALSRRSFLAMSATLPWALRAAAATQIPVGLELYSVRNALKQDLDGTVRAVAAMGYQCVEFYAPYFDWTEGQTKDMRKLLDDLGLRCYSTHNDSSYLGPEKISRARDLNLILGCKICGDGQFARESGPRWLEGCCELTERCRRATRVVRPEGRVSQSPS